MIIQGLVVIEQIVIINLVSQVIGKQLSGQMLVCPPPYLEKRGGAPELLLRSNRSLLAAAECC